MTQEFSLIQKCLSLNLRRLTGDQIGSSLLEDLMRFGQLRLDGSLQLLLALPVLCQLVERLLQLAPKPLQLAVLVVPDTTQARSQLFYFGSEVGENKKKKFSPTRLDCFKTSETLQFLMKN